MPGPFIPNQTPDWLKPENASVTDSALTQAMRRIGHLIGADNPTSQVLGLMMSEIPSGPSGGIAGALERLSQKAQTFIKAYHGSPHDFERFDVSKIGTGEGAQAYGHGLYFAENPAVAQDYKQSLSKGFEYQGQPIDPRSGLGRDLDFLSSNVKSGESMVDALPRRIKELRDHAAFMRKIEPNYGSDVMYDRAADNLAKLDPTQLKPAGKMYEVAIKADPEAFLDWDKPLSQQSQAVQDAIKALGPKNAQARDFWEKVYWRQDPSGQAIYRDVTPDAGGIPAERNATAAATLQKLGVPGIKYLDQGSRAAGEGSRNYVVFDDSLVDILKKYGVAGAAIEGLRRKAQAQGGSVTQDDILGAQ